MLARWCPSHASMRFNKEEFQLEDTAKCSDVSKNQYHLHARQISSQKTSCNYAQGSAQNLPPKLIVISARSFRHSEIALHVSCNETSFMFTSISGPCDLMLAVAVSLRPQKTKNARCRLPLPPLYPAQQPCHFLHGRAGLCLCHYLDE